MLHIGQNRWRHERLIKVCVHEKFTNISSSKFSLFSSTHTVKINSANSAVESGGGKQRMWGRKNPSPMSFGSALALSHMNLRDSDSVFFT
jgi:hypothetical protein